jgi:hypothetical protein
MWLDGSFAINAFLYAKKIQEGSVSYFTFRSFFTMQLKSNYLKRMASMVLLPINILVKNFSAFH